MASIDLDNEFLNLFFGITNKQIPENVTLLNLKNQLVDIVDLMKDLSKNSRKPMPANPILGIEEENKGEQGNAILVVDDLGVITYQLKILLSKFEMDVDCTQEIYDAINKFKKRKHSYVVMDLFIPTDREGFILLSEIKKMIAKENLNTVIGVVTASPKKEIEQRCKALGADFFVEKTNNWQEKLCKIIEGYVVVNDDEDDF